MSAEPASSKLKSTVIAELIRQEILSGTLTADARLPSEADLATKHRVSRPTVREALKRLAAQSLIRTKRGATGGAFVNRMSLDEAVTQQVNAHHLLIAAEELKFEETCAARFALERAALPFATRARKEEDLKALRHEIGEQSRGDITMEEFCASDTAFHRALVDASGNLVLSLQVSSAVESIQPLMNMITVNERSREEIIALHTRLADAVEARDDQTADRVLQALYDYTMKIFRERPKRFGHR